MSAKRQATSDLNHENWDQEEDPEEMGVFKTASKDELQKRVFKTARRRVHQSGDTTNKSVFSGFSGFNKPPPSSFDFLANLTNGKKSTDSPSTNNEASPSSSIFGSKATTSSFQGFQTENKSNSSPSKPTLPNFGGSSTNQSSPFTAFKPVENSNAGSSKLEGFKPNESIKSMFNAPACSVASPFASSTMMSKPFESTETPKSSLSPSKGIFSNNNTNSSNNTFMTTFNQNKPAASDSKKDEDKDPKKMKYYAKLKGLNESVTEWIKKHVDSSPLCILTPIFKDYEKYLEEIQDEYHGTSKPSNESSDKKSSDSGIFSVKPDTSSTKSTSNLSIFSPKPSADSLSVFSNAKTEKSDSSPSIGASTEKPSNPLLEPSKPITNGNTPFSFGIGKPFSFSPSTQNSSSENKVEEKKPDEEADDEPPKVEFTPVVEENSVFDKRCKIFVKKDENFVDKGVGTLYIKKLENGKHQLLVRANTNLGTILLNLILASALPCQRLGKNNVMLVCIPTPDTQPPPVPTLIRVKTSEEADELLEILNKYKA